MARTSPATKPLSKSAGAAVDVPKPATIVVSADSIVRMEKATTALDTSAQPYLEIATQAEYDAAARYRSEVTQPLIKEWDDDMGGVKSTAYQLYQQILGVYTKYAERVKVKDRAIKGAMERFAARQIEAQRAAARALESATRMGAEEAAAIEAQELLVQGDERGAQAILDKIERGEIEPSTPMPTQRVVAPKSDYSTTRMVWDFEVIDPTKIKIEFTLPNTTAIRGLVTKHHKLAEKMVGEGAIRAFEKPIVANK